MEAMKVKAAGKGPLLAGGIKKSGKKWFELVRYLLISFPYLYMAQLQQENKSSLPVLQIWFNHGYNYV
jgi:hypothetical protein